MRFGFEKGNRWIGAVQWEGPGQVALELEDEGMRSRFEGFFRGHETYLGGGEGVDFLQTRRRDWTPWEFERACHKLGHTLGYRVTRMPNEPVEARPAQGAAI